MANNSRGRYYVKNTAGGTFEDITTKFDGVAVLKVTGLDSKGKADPKLVGPMLAKRLSEA